MERTLKNYFERPAIKADINVKTSKIYNTFSPASKNIKSYEDLELFALGSINAEMDNSF